MGDAIKPDILQIKVTLRETKPPVWRRLLLPSNLNLEHLHQILQLAMGWMDCHLHEFEIGGRRYGAKDPDFDGVDERKVKLRDVLGVKGAKGKYTYDFGDGWEHSLLVEKVLPPEPGKAYPMCVAGKRACPPEDCGGPWGYEEFLEAMADPEHEQHEELSEWIGGEFDPEAFDVDEVNRMLK